MMYVDIYVSNPPVERNIEDIPCPLPIFPDDGAGVLPGGGPYDGDCPPILYCDVKDDEADPQSILQSIALSQAFVDKVRIQKVGDGYLVALIAKPFYLKSERDCARAALEDDMKRSTGADVAVTFDMDIFLRLKTALSDDEAAELLALTLSRR